MPKKLRQIITLDDNYFFIFGAMLNNILVLADVRLNTLQQSKINARILSAIINGRELPNLKRNSNYNLGSVNELENLINTLNKLEQVTTLKKEKIHKVIEPLFEGLKVDNEKIKFIELYNKCSDSCTADYIEKLLRMAYKISKQFSPCMMNNKAGNETAIVEEKDTEDIKKTTKVNIASFAYKEKLDNENYLLKNAVHIVESAAQQEGKKRKIYITFHSDRVMFSKGSKLYKEWMNALIKAESKGWRIDYYLPWVKQDTTSAIGIAKELTLYSSSINKNEIKRRECNVKYYLYSEDSNINSTHEIVLAESIGAVVFFADSGNILRDVGNRICRFYSGIVIKGNNCDFLRRHILFISKSRFTQTDKHYESYKDFLLEMNNAEISSQPDISEKNEYNSLTVRYHLAGCINALTMTAKYYKEHQSRVIRKKEISDTFIEQRIKTISKMSVFTSLGYKYKDIYSLESLDKFVIDGKYDECIQMEEASSLEERKEHIDNIIDMINQCNGNYEIAFINTEDENNFGINTNSFITVLRDRAFIQSTCTEINHTWIVQRGFHGYFEHIWDRLITGVEAFEILRDKSELLRKQIAKKG